METQRSEDNEYGNKEYLIGNFDITKLRGMGKYVVIVSEDQTKYGLFGGRSILKNYNRSDREFGDKMYDDLQSFLNQEQYMAALEEASEQLEQSCIKRDEIAYKVVRSGNLEIKCTTTKASLIRNNMAALEEASEQLEQSCIKRDEIAYKVVRSFFNEDYVMPDDQVLGEGRFSLDGDKIVFWQEAVCSGRWKKDIILENLEIPLINYLKEKGLQINSIKTTRGSLSW